MAKKKKSSGGKVSSGKKSYKKKKKGSFASFIKFVRSAIVLVIILTGVWGIVKRNLEGLHSGAGGTQVTQSGIQTANGEDIPAYFGSELVPVNNNVPYFSIEEVNSLNTDHYYSYSSLDSLSRAGVAIATITEDDVVSGAERGSLGAFSPSGWRGRTEGGIYDRSHLIAHSLGGVDEIENLITGTEDFNRSAMAKLEGRIREYIADTGKSVLYRVTPIYLGWELVPRGVLMEARSREGDLQFNMYAYNRQDGYSIDYFSGEVFPDKETVVIE